MQGGKKKEEKHKPLIWLNPIYIFVENKEIFSCCSEDKIFQCFQFFINSRCRKSVSPKSSFIQIFHAILLNMFSYSYLSLFDCPNSFWHVNAKKKKVVQKIPSKAK